MTRARLIVNPKSGTDQAPVLLPLINERLRAIVSELDVTLTTEAADATRAAARAVTDGCDALFVAGGDGTLNAALRGLVSGDEGGRHIPVGVIPLGTGNDFAKALDVGEDPEAALDVLLQGRVLDVDIGMLDDRPFVNTSAGGFIADVSDAVTEGLKDVTGKLAYLIGGARALLGTVPFSARIVIHGQGGGTPEWDGSLDLQLFAVSNARLIGGGYPIAPAALIDDGLLDVLLVPRMPMLEFIGVLQRIASGAYEDDPAVRIFRTSAFDLEFSRAVRVNTDGEVLDAESCRYRVRHRGGRFFCGAAPQASAAPLAL